MSDAREMHPSERVDPIVEQLRMAIGGAGITGDRVRYESTRVNRRQRSSRRRSRFMRTRSCSEMHRMALSASVTSMLTVLARVAPLLLGGITVNEFDRASGVA